jgi:hypothetical protein
MMEVYLVKEHSWDYDFHDEVWAVFSTREAAITYVDAHGKKYDLARETGMVVERWLMDGDDDDDHCVVYYQGGVTPESKAGDIKA